MQILEEVRINVEKEIAMDTELYDHDATGAYGRFLKDPFLGYDTLEKQLKIAKRLLRQR